MSNPRDKKFFELKKRDLIQLNIDELNYLLSISNVMLKTVTHSKARRSWALYIEKVEMEIQKKQNDC